MSAETVRLAGAAVRGEVQLLGGMAGPFVFQVDGREVQPFAVAPWADEPSEQLETLPPLLRRLRGEWPCVPFGGSRSPQKLPPDWEMARQETPAWHRHDHGFSSNHPWSIDDRSEDAVTLSIRYPDEHPIARLERRVACHPSEPLLQFSLTIHARADTTMPVGLHPVFRLPATSGAAALEMGSQSRIWSFPIDVEPDKSAAAPDQRDVAPADLKAADGSRLDLTRLPFADASEDLLVVAGTGGRMRLGNSEDGYRVSLAWDIADLPLCGLWLSNRGRSFYPWNARFTAIGIGIEPIAGAFDLGPAFSSGTPLAKAGLTTGVSLKAGEPWTTRYSIGVAAL